MYFNTAEGRFGTAWATESNTTKVMDCKIVVPADLIFRRLYLGWFHYQIGEPEVLGSIQLKYRGKIESEVPFSWIENLVTANLAGRTNVVLWVPGFTVDKRPYGAGNAYPYSLPATPNSKVCSMTYQEFVPGTSTYNLQITCQPFHVAERCDEVNIHFECRSGISTGNGLLVGVASVDSSKLPFGS